MKTHQKLLVCCLLAWCLLAACLLNACCMLAACDIFAIRLVANNKPSLPYISQQAYNNFKCHYFRINQHWTMQHINIFLSLLFSLFTLLHFFPLWIGRVWEWESNVQNKIVTYKLLSLQLCTNFKCFSLCWTFSPGLWENVYLGGGQVKIEFANKKKDITCKGGNLNI